MLKRWERDIDAGMTVGDDGLWVFAADIPPAILRCLDDPTLSAALEVVARKFSWGRFLRDNMEIKAIYKDAIAADQAAASRTTRDANARRDREEGI